MRVLRCRYQHIVLVRSLREVMYFHVSYQEEADSFGSLRGPSVIRLRFHMEQGAATSRLELMAFGLENIFEREWALQEGMHR